MRALPVMWAVHGSALRFLAAARPGDGALLNSDMRGRDPFLNEMIEVLAQHPSGDTGRSRYETDKNRDTSCIIHRIFDVYLPVPPDAL